MRRSLTRTAWADRSPSRIIAAEPFAGSISTLEYLDTSFLQTLCFFFRGRERAQDQPHGDGKGRVDRGTKDAADGTGRDERHGEQARVGPGVQE